VTTTKPNQTKPNQTKPNQTKPINKNDIYKYRLQPKLGFMEEEELSQLKTEPLMKTREPLGC